MTANPAQLDRVLHPHARLAIIKALRAAEGPLDFSSLREDLQLTGGNLFSHLRALEEEGIIQRVRESPLGRTRSVYQLTDAGLERVLAYARVLAQLAADLGGNDS
ncbi:MAG: transcriptional regulator [Myxococcota bacterium]